MNKVKNWCARFYAYHFPSCAAMNNKISSVVEFYTWWVEKSKIFGQKSITLKETIVYFENTGSASSSKIPSIFDIENWLWKYNFSTFWQIIIHCRIALKNSCEHVDSWKRSCILGPTIVKIPQPNWH